MNSSGLKTANNARDSHFWYQLQETYYLADDVFL